MGVNILGGLRALIKQVQGKKQKLQAELDLNYSIQDFLGAGFSLTKTQLNQYWTDNIEVYPLAQYTPQQARRLDLVRLYGAGMGTLVSKPL